MRDFNRLLAALGMPEELPPCGDTCLEDAETEPCFCAELHERLSDLDISVGKFLELIGEHGDLIKAMTESLEVTKH